MTKNYESGSSRTKNYKYIRPNSKPEPTHLHFRLFVGQEEQSGLFVEAEIVEVCCRLDGSVGLSRLPIPHFHHLGQRENKVPCCWSGSVGFICFWASRIRIRIHGSESGSGSFYHSSKIVRQTLIPTVLWLLYDFLYLKNDINVPSKSNKQKKLNYFLLKSWRSLTKIAGSGSISFRGIDPRIRIRTKI